MTTTHYIWDEENDSYFMETDGDGNVTAVYTNEPVPYGRVISQRRGNATSFYHYDGQGSTRQLTDENGNVTDEYTYTAFGETVAQSGTTVNPFRYHGSLGYYRDGENDEYYVRSRRYRQSLARWMSPDPAYADTPVPGYIYVRNSPLMYWDPSGLKAADCSPPNGVTYIGGRGMFSPAPFVGSIQDVYNRIGGDHVSDWDDDPTALVSAAYAVWQADPNKFDIGCKCCCDQIGFVQIIKRTTKYSGVAWWTLALEERSGWWIDASAGEFSYGEGLEGVPGTAAPCERPSKSITFWDAPGVKRFSIFPWLAAVVSHEDRFETCVVCLAGIEGPSNSMKVFGELVEWHRNLAVYDCFEWGQTWNRDNNGRYTVARGVTRTGGGPSATFVETLRVEDRIIPAPFLP